MGPLQQHGVNIERPPYYHLPRSRPVGFERPDHGSWESYNQDKAYASSYLRENLAPYVGQNRESEKENKLKMFADNKLTSNCLPVYNSSPQPYNRNQADYDERQQTDCTRQVRQQAGSYVEVNYIPSQQQTPEILVNDRASTYYPTSTVHKSMLNTHRSTASSRSGTENALNYSRLISPTVMTASYESLSPTRSLSRNTNTIDSSIGNEVQIEIQVHKQRQNEADGVEQSSRRQTASRDEPSQVSQASFINKTTDNDTNSLQLEPQGGVSVGEGSSLAQRGSLGASSKNNAVGHRSDYLQRKLPSSLETMGQMGLSSNSVLPDTKRDDYMWNRQLERVSIAHQTYRTLPIVMPKPKARHDLASGTYMRYMQDPTWELTRSRSSSTASKDQERRSQIQQAIKSEVSSIVF